nr:hypothetical protein [Pseudodesulfovibrio sp.]
MAKKPILTFQVEPEEEAMINRYMKENEIKKKSPFFREAIFGWMASDQPQLTREMVDEFNSWRKEFHGVGSNLNQIAYKMNANHPLSNGQIVDTLEDLRVEFKVLAKRMRKLRNVFDI